MQGTSPEAKMIFLRNNFFKIPEIFRLSYICRMFLQEKPLRVAIIDMYNGEPSQGMRCIREILNQYGEYNKIDLDFEEFDIRRKLEIPDTSYAIYICTGGPGNPVSSEGSEWDNQYFSLIRQLEAINQSDSPEKKYVFFICHSFQLICRYYAIGKISLRKSPSFGVFPMHKTSDGEQEEFFKGLPNPFYAVDSRRWQVTEPDKKQLEHTGAKILAIEKERPHVPLERALMAVRFSDYFFGTQFHPEADPVGMTIYLEEEEKKKEVIKDLGDEKYLRMLEQLHDPDKIMLTQNLILPAFLDHAVSSLQEAE